MASPADELTAKTSALTLSPEPDSVVIEEPTSPSSGIVLSRFEFETAKANDGTKILMVEWDGSVAVPPANGTTASSKPSSAAWSITWDAQTPVLPVRDASASSPLLRVYFLLPPGSSIPPLITLTHKTLPSAPVLRTKPMPAIFPPNLTPDTDPGKRGVLHTIWAKKRLAELDREIVEEMKANGESVGLEMAVQEKEWIVEHFGVVSKGEGRGVPALRIPVGGGGMGPASPRSPIGGRLGEKLRGLKLVTGTDGLAQAAKSATPRMQPLMPPAVGKRGDNVNGGVGSLNAIVGTTGTLARPAGGEEATEEDLFALPMSPRSPEMKRSPFSLL